MAPEVQLQYKYVVESEEVKVVEDTWEKRNDDVEFDTEGESTWSHTARGSGNELLADSSKKLMASVAAAARLTLVARLTSCSASCSMKSTSAVQYILILPLVIYYQSFL